MPELPDLLVYREAMVDTLVGRQLRALQVPGVALLRTVSPSPADLVGRTIEGIERIGKRLVLVFEDEHFAVMHLMVAGRLRWLAADARPPGRIAQAVFRFDHGQLVLTEAGKKRRARLHLVAGRKALVEHDPGGLEPLEIDGPTFATALRGRNHTLKRALSDPRILSGIGNAYSDEILHRARLSPVTWTSRLDDDAMTRLHAATQAVLREWIERLRAEAKRGFPNKVTAFRPDMVAHGKHGEPCADCGQAIQRIVYASRETNYCAHCQTGGKLLRDRALSRLLRGDWPRTVEELEFRARG